MRQETTGADALFIQFPIYMPLSQKKKKNVFGALFKIHEDKIRRDQDKKSKSEARSEGAPVSLVCEALACSRPTT